jgi:pilus assembly protein Flp/PilA
MVNKNAGFGPNPLNACFSGNAYEPYPMFAKLTAFVADENGATAIEYGLIAAGIALAVISAVKGIGTKLNTTFSSISTQLK